MKNTLTMLLFVAILISCSNDDDQTTLTPIITDSTNAFTEIPSNINNLFTAHGNPNAKRVIIYEQGGPDHKLSSDTYEPEHDSGEFEMDEVGFSELYKNDYRVYIHQASTLDPKHCNLGKITKSQAELENLVTVEILDRVINHFKAQGKTVWVTGFSFGGFVLSKYIAEKGNKSADKFLIMGSRLDMQLTVAEKFFNNTQYYFENGIYPVQMSGEDAELFKAFFDNCPTLLSIGSAMISERFTNTLNSNNLSNVVYVFANDDESVGSLEQHEKDYLKLVKSKVIEIPIGGHDAMFWNQYPQLIYNELNR